MGGLGFRGGSACSAVVWGSGVGTTVLRDGGTASCTLVLGRGCEGTLLCWGTGG